MIRSLSVVIPAYNEEARLPRALDRVSAYLATCDFAFAELIVVDDGSTDRTRELAEAFAHANPCARVLKNPANRGKGYSVREGMLAARGEWRLLSDADLSAPIEEMRTLWEAAERTGADIAIGSRALRRELIAVRQPFLRETAGKFFNFLMQRVTGLRIRDTQCGFKLFSQRAVEIAFPRQQLERFGFDVEVLLIAHLHGLRIEEVPVRWGHAEGTKVNLWSGAQSFFDLVQIRLNQWQGKYR